MTNIIFSKYHNISNSEKKEHNSVLVFLVSNLKSPIYCFYN